MPSSPTADRPTRWDGLALLKLIACVVVVLLHCPLPGALGDLVIYALRFSVPCFFMISGYFAYGREPSWALRHAGRTAVTLLALELGYGAWTWLIHALHWLPDLSDPLTVGEIVRKLLCGAFFNETLWYMYALAYGWLIYWVLLRRGWLEKAFALILPLLAFQIYGRLYIQTVSFIRPWLFLFRNALAFGLPFMLLGSWCRAHEQSLLGRWTLPRCVLLALGAGGLICIEYAVSGQYLDLHASSVVLSMALFLGALQVPVLPGRAGELLVYAGRHLTAGVYYAHAFVATAAGLLLDPVPAPVVIGLSFAIAWGADILGQRLKKQ